MEQGWLIASSQKPIQPAVAAGAVTPAPTGVPVDAAVVVRPGVVAPGPGRTVLGATVGLPAAAARLFSDPLFVQYV